METCWACSHGPLENGQDTDTYNIGGVTLGVTIPCRKCSNCGEVVYTFTELHNGNIAIALHCLSHGINNAAVHIFCRKTLGLTRDALAQCYGTTGAIVKDMEQNGSVSEANWIVLTSLLSAAAAEAAFVPTVIVF